MIRSPLAILLLLTGLNLLNYIDRLVVSAVLPAMGPELALSKFEGGLLATVFLVGYSVTSPLFGSLGDRGSRTRLIALGVSLWSAATVASGFAVGPWSLLVARALVGVGEASYATLAPTIIDDLAPASKRGRWLAVFYVAMPVGAALGYLIGGAVASRWGWRSAFFVAGGPGLVLALVSLLIKEPARTTTQERPNVRRDIGTLVRIPVYRKAVLGYCAYTAAIGAFSHWAPTFLVERYAGALSLKTATFWFGIVTVVGGIVGTAVGGVLADAGKRRAPEDAASLRSTELRKLFRLCAGASLIGAPLAAACFLSGSHGTFFAIVGPTEVVLFVATSPINALLLRSVPSELRASALALSIFAIHALGDFWSPALVGLLADHAPMHVAMMALPAFLGLSAILWWPRLTSEAQVEY